MKRTDARLRYAGIAVWGAHQCSCAGINRLQRARGESGVQGPVRAILASFVFRCTLWQATRRRSHPGPPLDCYPVGKRLVYAFLAPEPTEVSGKNQKVLSYASMARSVF